MDCFFRVPFATWKMDKSFKVISSNPVAIHLSEHPFAGLSSLDEAKLKSLTHTYQDNGLFLKWLKNGSPKWFHWNVWKEEDCFYFSASDVTALKEEELSLHQILDAIPDMILVKGEKSRIIWANKAFKDYYNMNFEELKDILDAPFQDPEFTRQYVVDDTWVWNNKKSLRTAVEPVTRFDGVIRKFETLRSPIFDWKGEIRMTVGVSRDITDNLVAEEMQKKIFEEQVAKHELEKLLETRDEFISITSHELKTPLATLVLQAQMLKRKIDFGAEDAYSPVKIRHMLEVTEKQVFKLDHIVNDMLDVSRMRTGEISIDRKDFDLRELVVEVLERMNEPVKLVSSVNRITGNWDRLRIEQVLQNLLTNAVRYGNGKPVEIRLSDDVKVARFSVHDNGIGIAKEHQGKIFDRFFRAINANEISGLGLGLYICHQIVKAHHGKIWVESDPGKGTSFFVELPK